MRSKLSSKPETAEESTSTNDWPASTLRYWSSVPLSLASSTTCPLPAAIRIRPFVVGRSVTAPGASSVNGELDHAASASAR